MAQSTETQQLRDAAERQGLYMRTYSPGDGATRYRFTRDRNSGYFGPDSGIYTALGRKEANAFLEGFLAGCDQPAALAAIARERERLLNWATS